MANKKTQDSSKELVIQYLKKNKNIFVNHPELLEQLEYPSQLKGTNNIIDLNLKIIS